MKRGGWLGGVVGLVHLSRVQTGSRVAAGGAERGGTGCNRLN